MKNDTIFDEYYKKYIKDLSKWLPEGVVDVNLALLHRLGLLSVRHPVECNVLSQFRFIHTNDKKTFISDEFIVWMVADQRKLPTSTYVLVALNKKEGPKLECAFIAKGIYNIPEIIYRVLEKYLSEIHETEQSIQKY